MNSKIFEEVDDLSRLGNIFMERVGNLERIGFYFKEIKLEDVCGDELEHWFCIPKFLVIFLSGYREFFFLQNSKTQ